MSLLTRIALAAVALAFALPASAVRITPAHSGSWYDPAYDKQGFGFEVLDKTGNGPERYVAVYWYTYDDDGAPVWAIGVGETDGNVVELTMNRAFGGARPPIQQPAEDLQEWATMTFTFGTCNTAVADFTMTDSGETGTYNLVRLTQIGATSCTGGMGDEMGPDEEPATIVAQLRGTGEYSGANGTARYHQRPGFAEFVIDVRLLAEGDYGVFVGGEDKGIIEVRRVGNGNGAPKGSISFRSPGDPLLDFDPRGQLLEIVDADGIVAMSVDFPAQGSDDDGSDD